MGNAGLPVTVILMILQESLYDKGYRIDLKRVREKSLERGKPARWRGLILNETLNGKIKIYNHS